MVNQSKLDLKFQFKKKWTIEYYMPQKNSYHILVTSWIRIALDILIVTIIDDGYILNLVSRQVTGVIIKPEKIRATLY